LPTGHQDVVNSLAFTPDGQTLISVGQDHTIRWWDTWTGQQRLCLPCTGNGKQVRDYAPYAALSPDGATLAVTYKDAPEGEKEDSHVGIRLYDAAIGKERHRLDGGSCRPDKLIIDKLAFSPDGKLLAHVFPRHMGEDPCRVRLWDVATGKRYENE